VELFHLLALFRAVGDEIGLVKLSGVAERAWVVAPPDPADLAWLGSARLKLVPPLASPRG
jgi:hypothetical protein